MSSRHRIDLTARVGFGDSDTLTGLQQRLAWYQRHPAVANSPRGKQRIAILTREIAQMQRAA